MNEPGRPPQLPYDDIHAALGADPGARSELEALQAHLDDPKPDPARIRGHVDALRGIRDAEAHVVNWWDSPETQTWIQALTNAGL